MRVKRFSLVIVSTLFFIGILAGCVYCAGLDEAEILLISGALKDYCAYVEYNFSQVLRALLLSFAFPAVIIAGTLAGLGIVIIPAAMLAGGFALSTSVSVFIVSMGKHAAASAFFVCGLPNLIIMPFLFFFASEMLCVALNRAEISVVRKASRDATLFRKRLLLCTAAFIAGSFVRAFLSPYLLSQL